MKAPNMVIKVQISQFNSKDKVMMLVYNKDKSLWYEGEATKEVIDLMGGLPKKYFNAEVNKRKFVIESEAKTQKW